MSDELTTPDPWQTLKTLTPARIALGRVGTSLPTQEVLNFSVQLRLNCFEDSPDYMPI
jgi:ethanolamine ammonia-lyase small subunit